VLSLPGSSSLAVQSDDNFDNAQFDRPKIFDHAMSNVPASAACAPVEEGSLDEDLELGGDGAVDDEVGRRRHHHLRTQQ
jgi:hypothetical protein